MESLSILHIGTLLKIKKGDYPNGNDLPNLIDNREIKTLSIIELFSSFVNYKKKNNMTEKELDLLQKAFKDSHDYLEFGSGNSTQLAVNQNNMEHITVVESDPMFWKGQVLNTPSVELAVQSSRLTPLLVNIGPVGEWGYPLDESYKDQWPLYSSLAFQGKTAYDLVLVDGRFRIACILQACLHCSAKTKILIHDFFNRPNYFVVYPFLKLEDQADTLGLFTINKGKALDILEEYLSIYQVLPGF